MGIFSINTLYLLAMILEEKLLQIKAIKLQPQNPFTWASGWYSPIYCDNRLLLSFPDIRSFVKKELSRLVIEKFPSVNKIAGVATAGISHGTLVADALGLPFAYVRPEPKKHGKGQQIEGLIEIGDKVVLIEDLISTGSSSLKAVEAVRKINCSVLGIAALFTYGFDIAKENFKNSKCSFYTLGSYSHLLKYALEINYISNDDLKLLNDWREDPANWNKA